ncbi:hypothetical protein Efla_000215 [Eimeria flavescens]
MPGIYSKPPRRAEFASDIRCLLESAAPKLLVDNAWILCVQTLLDEFETERAKARQEAALEKEGGAAAANGLTEEEITNKIKRLQLVARKEVEVAEVFFECGVHEFFCKILETADPSAHSAVFGQILRVYDVYLLIEVDPFDDDMGLVSLLNFFLSERHAYYIDIHWRENELSHMQLFVSALLRLLAFQSAEKGVLCLSSQSTSNSQEASPRQKPESCMHLKLEAARLLRSALWTFPPHRVVSRMALAFSRVRCAELLRGCSSMLADSSSSSLADVDLLAVQVEVVAAVAFFGVGPAIIRQAVPAALAWSCSSFVESGGQICLHHAHPFRCPCSSCEFQRRLLKLLRNRDELGVQTSAEAKRQICFSLVRAGVTDFLIQAAEAAKTVAAGIDRSALHAASSRTASSVFEGIAWILLLCSWAYEDVHQGQSILSARNTSLLGSLVAALEAASEAAPSDLAIFSGDGGASTLLRVLLCLLLKTNACERRRLLQVAGPLLSKLAVRLCKILQRLSPNACNAGGEQDQDLLADADGQAHRSTSKPRRMQQSLSAVAASDASLDPQERGLKTALLLLSFSALFFEPPTSSSCTPSASAAEHQQQQQEEAVCPQMTALLAGSCQSLADIFELLHPRFAHMNSEAAAEEQLEGGAAGPPAALTGPAGFEPRQFFLGLLGLMAVLMGALSLQGVEPLRWRFVRNPLGAAQPATAGGFASLARLLLAHSKKTHEEGCQINKKLAGLVVLRSEQAAAMVLRPKSSSAPPPSACSASSSSFSPS